MPSLKQKHHWKLQPKCNISQVTDYNDHHENILVQKILVDAMQVKPFTLTQNYEKETRGSNN
jgi:hypothetical protein